MELRQHVSSTVFRGRAFAEKFDARLSSTAFHRGHLRYQSAAVELHSYDLVYRVFLYTSHCTLSTKSLAPHERTPDTCDNYCQASNALATPEQYVQVVNPPLYEYDY